MKQIKLHISNRKCKIWLVPRFLAWYTRWSQGSSLKKSSPPLRKFLATCLLHIITFSIVKFTHYFQSLNCFIVICWREILLEQMANVYVVIVVGLTVGLVVTSVTMVVLGITLPIVLTRKANTQGKFNCRAIVSLNFLDFQEQMGPQ
jgi:hypothetical protein